MATVNNMRRSLQCFKIVLLPKLYTLVIVTVVPKV